MHIPINRTKKVTFWFGKEGDAIFPLQTLYNNQAGYENIELLEDSVLYELSVDKLHDLYLADIHIANWGRKFAERGVYQIRTAIYITAVQDLIGTLSGFDC